jgi:hypothetical protein
MCVRSHLESNSLSITWRGKIFRKKICRQKRNTHFVSKGNLPLNLKFSRQFKTEVILMTYQLIIREQLGRFWSNFIPKVLAQLCRSISNFIITSATELAFYISDNTKIITLYLRGGLISLGLYKENKLRDWKNVFTLHIPPWAPYTYDFVVATSLTHPR